MSEEQLSRLFAPFVQADESTTRQYGGTGLGLVISKYFCEMMSGSIDVTSQEEAGSTFTVRLPIVMSDKRPLAANTSLHPETGRKSLA